MNSFTFLTNNPPLAVVSTYHLGSSESDVVIRHPPCGVAGPAAAPDIISPTRRLPDARKDQWSVDIQREALGQQRRRSPVHRLQYQPPRSQLLQQHAARRARARSIHGVPPRCSGVAGSSRTICIADYDAVTFGLRQRMHKGLQVDGHYTWSRTRDISTHSNGGGQTMDNYDIWRDYADRRSGMSRHRPVAMLSLRHSVPEDLVAAGSEISRGGLAGLRRDYDPERRARQRHCSAPIAPTSASRGSSGPTGRAGPGAELCLPIRIRRCDQLMNCYDASALRCRRSSRSATRRATFCAVRNS